MPDQQSFLFELGTEELPPKALPRLGEALFDGICAGLQQRDLSFNADGSRWFAAPRRLAVQIAALASAQPDRSEQRLGPAVAAAYDADGNPTRAAEGFARSCGTSVDQLAVVETPKGERLGFQLEQAGAPVAELLPEIISQALDRLPIPKRMRWGDSEAQFVRPVHWMVMLYGDQVIPATLLDTESGNQSLGHRFHHPDAVTICSADQYAQALQQAHVVADFDQRRRQVVDGVAAAAEQAGVSAMLDPALVDEVTALVEWPIALVGEFDERFLELPEEVLIATMQGHQKYFPCRASSGALANRFVGVSNLESSDPAQVVAGYQRVIRPRLADARFFWDKDLATPLESHQSELRKMVFQEKLGTLWQKVERVQKIIRSLAEALGLRPQQALDAAELCKCDLLTDLVGEFPELQGCMGRYYAERQGVPAEIAEALEQHYWPRFAGDAIPEGQTSQLLALADRLDSLAGIFAAGMKPTGTKDPFALRRAALGVVRIILEGELDLDLRAQIDQAVQVVRQHDSGLADCADEVYAYVMERARGYFAEQGWGGDAFDAVSSAPGASGLLDIAARGEAVAAFRHRPEAVALAAANKRIRNILRKAEWSGENKVDSDLFADKAESSLWDWLSAVRRSLGKALSQRDYADALNQLASLRDPVDLFFDEVLVMAEDEAVRANRMALLAAVRESFLEVADISMLQMEGGDDQGA